MKRLPVKFEDYGSSFATLRCPNCNDHYLHQTDVAVFNRSEDEDQTKVTTVYSDGGVHEGTIAESVALNPSPRRHGIRISFWCEHCDAGLTDDEPSNKVPDLAIYQHKGNTIIEWVE